MSGFAEATWPRGQEGRTEPGRSMGGASCRNVKVTGQIWRARLLMCVRVSVTKRGENKTERKREGEV